MNRKGRGSDLEYNYENANIIYNGLKKCGINFITFLPDSWNREIVKLVVNDKELKHVMTSREDEGIAIAMGAQLGGKKPCMIMEGSGYGLSGLVLVRPGIVQRLSLLILSSHTSSMGEMSSSHSESKYLIEPMLRALGIPYSILTDIRNADTVIEEAQVMVEGQQTTVAILIPRHIYFRRKKE